MSDDTTAVSGPACRVRIGLQVHEENIGITVRRLTGRPAG
jgi:hypothetical protein